MGFFGSFRFIRGAALVEIIVSAVIVGTCLVTVFGVAGLSLKASVIASEKVQAAYLLDGGVDAVKFLRDVGWDQRIASKQLGQPYCLDFGGGINFSEYGLTLASMPRMLHLRMEESSGTLADSSGRNHPATTAGGVTYAQPGVASTNALQFNGTTGYAQINDHNDFNVGSFTLEAWIKRSNTNLTRQRIVSHHEFFGQGWYMSIFNNLLEFGSTLDALGATKGVPLIDGGWHHVAVVRDIASLQKVARWYVDDKLVGSQNLSSTAVYNVTANMSVGSSVVFGAAEFFGGTIDEVSVINRALTAQEIYEEYAAGSVCRKLDNKFTRTVTFKNACRENESSSTYDISTESTVNGTCPGGAGRVADALTKLVTFNIVGGGANISADTYLTKMFLCSYI